MMSDLAESRPLVSVIMPAYNVKRYIAEAIESVITQTYKNWELIIVDDASSDGTLKIVEQYLTADSRIKITHNPENHGIGYCRDIALKMANGEYIAFLDADDIYLRNSLEIRLDFIEKSKCYNAVFGRHYNYNKDGLFTNENYTLPTNNLKRLIEGADGYKFFLAGLLLKKSLADKLIMPHLRHDEDSFFITNLFLDFHEEVAFLDDKVFLYRVNDNSVTHSVATWLSRLNYEQEALHFISHHPNWSFNNDTKAKISIKYTGILNSILVHRKFRPYLCKIIVHAFKDSSVSFTDWSIKIAPYTVFIFMPRCAIDFLRRIYRNRKYTKIDSTRIGMSLSKF